MGRLRVRIALLSAFSIVLTVALILVVQDIYFARSVEQLNPALKDAEATMQTLETGAILGEEARFDIIREALRKTAASEAETKQLLLRLDADYNAQRRIPRLAALISLPIALLNSVLLAWVIAKPIRRVVGAAERIANGDLSARAAPTSQAQKRAGELAELIYNFDLMAAALERLEHERQNMIADIAHELRTPLTVLQGQIDAMREGVRPLSDTSLARLDRQTQLLARLVQDLRTLSLAEAGRLSLNLERLDFAKFVARVTASFNERSAQRGIYLTFTSDMQGMLIVVDPDRLEQVLSNLISNALRYTPEGGTVAVGVQPLENCVSFTVEDTGPGLSEEALARVFNRFYKAGDRTSVTEGSGLGLAIAQTLIKLHKGTIEVSNAAHGGAVFQVTLARSAVSLADQG